MKRLIFLCFFLLLLAGEARAEELPEELLESVPEAGQAIQAGSSFEEGLSGLLGMAQEALSGVLRQGTAGVVELLLLLFLCGIGETVFASASGKTGFNYMALASVAAVVAVSAGDLNQLIGMGTETITELSQFSKALLPALAAATASSGLVGTASVKQVGTVFFSDILITLIERVLLPFLYLYIGALAAGAMLGDKRLDAIAAAIRKGVVWALSALLTGFTLYLSVAGVISGAADAVAVKVTKSAIASAIPVVGSIVSGTAETVLAGAGILKNSIGVFGLLVILATCLTPFLHLAVQYLLYKLAAFAASTVSSPPLVKLIDGLAGAFGLVLGMVGSCALVLLISILSSLLAVRI